MNKVLNSDGFFEARRILETCARWKVPLGVRPRILKALTEKPVKADAPAQYRGLPLQPVSVVPKRLCYFSDCLWKELLDVYNNGSSGDYNINQGGTKICRKNLKASRRFYTTP